MSEATPSAVQANNDKPAANYGLSWMSRTVGGQRAADRSNAGPRDELRSYLESLLEEPGEDVIAWWGVSYVIYAVECGANMLQKHSTQYPILARIARDYLPIQGSVTPSERAFSSASLTDTKQRNRLSPDIFEALQTLKNMYRNGHLSAAAEALSHYQTVMGDVGGQDEDNAIVVT